MSKKIDSYSIATKMVKFSDGNVALLRPSAASMIERMLYMLASKKDNFDEDTFSDNEEDIKEGIKNG